MIVPRQNAGKERPPLLIIGCISYADIKQFPQMIISIYHEGALGKVLTSRPIKGDNDEIVHASGYFFFFF